MAMTYAAYIQQAEDCLARAYGDVRDEHEQDFYHARAQVFATLAVASKPSAGNGIV